jgi:hypothetical protein
MGNMKAHPFQGPMHACNYIKNMIKKTKEQAVAHGLISMDFT